MNPKTATGAQKLVLQIFNACNFDQYRRIEWWIYGAKHRPCLECLAPQYSPCLNKSDQMRIKRGAKIPQRTTKWPHEERVDWTRVLRGLSRRGYTL